MTLSEDFNFAEQGNELDDATSAYPVVFGVTLTPLIIGIVVGVVGLMGSAYMLFNLVLPALTTYNDQQTQSTILQEKINQKTIEAAQINKVKAEQVAAEKQKAEVLGLFSNETTLDTLLLDINKLIEASNTQVPANGVKAQLKKFVPSAKPEIVKDGSLGPGVDNKLKRLTVKLEIQGTYEQTQSIMRNIERLQPLLIVANYQSELAPIETTSLRSKHISMPKTPPKINTSFDLQALIPLTPEELAAQAPTTSKPKGKK